MIVQDLAALRQLYATPQPRAVKKQISCLDEHCRRFIGVSPFVVLSTCDREYRADASPRGGEPGFVKVNRAGEVLIPDAPGNNRLDSLENMVSTGTVGLLFLIPGFDETLRVNGTAVLSLSQVDIEACATQRRVPKLVVRVVVQAAYLHCAKAFMRSKLWESDSRVDRSMLPSAGQMISDQTGIEAAAETREAMARRYAPDL